MQALLDLLLELLLNAVVWKSLKQSVGCNRALVGEMRQCDPCFSRAPYR